jgi:hypothetical protein
VWFLARPALPAVHGGVATLLLGYESRVKTPAREGDRPGKPAVLRNSPLLSLAILKKCVARQVVKRSQSTPKRVVFGPFQTPLVQAITKPTLSQW